MTVYVLQKLFILALGVLLLYYHASQVGNLHKLAPHVSNHNIPFVYFSSKRENVLVYLSNAIEKHCKEIGLCYEGPYKKWGSYGFQNGIIHLDEYYPNALSDTYKGVSGYIYSTKNVEFAKEQPDIPFVFTTTSEVVVENCEFIEDAYKEILLAESKGEIIINRYEELSQNKLDWIHTNVKKEYENNQDKLDYCSFLKAKFPTIIP